MLQLTNFAAYFGLVGLMVAFIIYGWVKKQPNGNERMVELEGMIHRGAMAFLKTEYSILVFFIAIVFILLFAFINYQTAIAYLAGAGCSILAGVTGMSSATAANSRTAWAANQSGQAKALTVSFFGGSVMGLAVASLGLLGVGTFLLCTVKILQRPATSMV